MRQQCGHLRKGAKEVCILLVTPDIRSLTGPWDVEARGVEC